MSKQKKIFVGILLLGLIISVFPLSASGGEGTRGDRAATVTITSVTIDECPVVDNKYCLGFWAVNVSFNVQGGAINNAVVQISVNGPPGNFQNSTNSQTYNAGGHFENPFSFDFSEQGIYTVSASITSTESNPGPNNQNLNFQFVTSFSITNISLAGSPKAATGEYGIIMQPHRVSADIENTGNRGWGDPMNPQEAGMNVTIQITLGGDVEEMMNNEFIFDRNDCPQPGETISLEAKNKMFNWIPSQEGIFAVEITANDMRSDESDFGTENIEIKNISVLAIHEVKTDPDGTVGQMAPFIVIVELDPTGSNCESEVEIDLEIKDHTTNVVVYSDNVNGFVEAPTEEHGMRQGQQYTPVYFNDVLLNKTGTYDIYISIPDFSLNGQGSVQVAEVPNDAPTLEDKTGAISSKRKDDTIEFRVKFTDTKYTPGVKCEVIIDEGTPMEMTWKEDTDLNYSAGELFEYTWTATAGAHSYKIKGTDGIASVSTDPKDFLVSDLGPGEGRVSGTVTNKSSNLPIAGATLTITNKTSQGAIQKNTATDGKYEAILSLGHYTIGVEAIGYWDGMDNFLLTATVFEKVKDFSLTPEGAPEPEFGTLTGYVKTIDKNGTESYLGGAYVILKGTGNINYYDTSVNGTGMYKIYNIPVGEYPLTVSLNKYDKIEEETITIVEGENRRDFTLKENDENGGVIEPDNHVVTIIVQQSDAQVFVGLDPLDISASGIYRVRLVPGQYLITAHKDGFLDFAKVITVPDDLCVEIDLSDVPDDDDDGNGGSENKFQEKIGPILNKDGYPVSDVEVSFTFNNVTYKGLTNTEGYAEFPQIYIDFPELNLNLPKNISIIAIKNDWKSTWILGDSIPRLTKIGESAGADADSKDGGISNSLWIILIIIFIIASVIIVTLLILKRKRTKHQIKTKHRERRKQKNAEKIKTFYCPKCGKSMIFHPQYNQWYCNMCKAYKSQIEDSLNFQPVKMGQTTATYQHPPTPLHKQTPNPFIQESGFQLGHTSFQSAIKQSKSVTTKPVSTISWQSDKKVIPTKPLFSIQESEIKPVQPSMANLIPGYLLTHKLGSGGFATVYKALDSTGNPVAIKLPKFMDETVDMSVLHKFKAESDIWKKLKHKNIVTFYTGDIRPVPYMVIEYMKGGNLLNVLRGEPIPIDVAISLIQEVLSGMAYAHRMASVHRDLKPENILFTEDGVPKISDWGIGKFMASESTEKTMGTKGTLVYSAPEQVSPKKYGEVDWSTDVFQLGIMFYELLTGVNPFRADDPVGIINNIINEVPVPPSSLRPGVPPEIDTVILRALEKEKDKRFSSADSMLEEMKRVLKG